MPQYIGPSVCPSVTFSYPDDLITLDGNTSKLISPPNSEEIVIWRFLRNRRLILRLHTIFRALIYRARRTVVPSIAWHLVCVFRRPRSSHLKCALVTNRSRWPRSRTNRPRHLGATVWATGHYGRRDKWAPPFGRRMFRR